MWILDPISIATSGYVGIGPGAGDYCPLPLAIGTHGYVRFDVEPPEPDIEIPGGDSSARHKRMLDQSLDGLLVREDDEVLSIIMAISKGRH